MSETAKKNKRVFREFAEYEDMSNFDKREEKKKRRQKRRQRERDKWES